MAEIKIEKKKPVWPWIILVLIILAILYFLFFANGDGDNERDGTDDIEQVEDTTVWENEQDTTRWDPEGNDTTSTNAVSTYITHIGDTSRMGIDHEYTNDALLRLLDAVEAKAQTLNVNINADLQEARQLAENITRNPQSTDHAGSIQNSGRKITDGLEKLQQEKFPDLGGEVNQVRTAVENIDPATETLQQKDRVNEFFNEAADVLQKMN